MINRIFKTILVLTICFGLTIPTNAAVSVSDGSAFVTKAEFAADLNNLSNRMAQLENSLDAKIDSLVSSYLTRNGIWNGAKQDYTNTFTWNGKDVFYSVDTSSVIAYYAHSASSWASYNSYRVSKIAEYVPKLLTTTPMNKTGLLRCEVLITTQNDQPIWIWTQADWSDHLDFWVEEAGLMVGNTSSIPTSGFENLRLYSDVFSNQQVNTNAGGLHNVTVADTGYAFRFNSQTLRKQWYAFVNKGAYLYVYYRWYWRPMSGKLCVRTDTAGTYRQLRIDVSELSIY